MNRKEAYQQDCRNILSILSQLSGREKYLYAHALQGAVTAASGVVAAKEDVRYASDFLRILEEATDIVNEYEGDNPSEELHLKPKENSD